MIEPIRVIVTGAGGRMGREVVKMVLQDEQLTLAAAVSHSTSPIDAGTLVGLEPCGVIISQDLEMRSIQYDSRCTR